MFKSFEYYVAHKPNKNGVINLVIAAFVNREDAVQFCKLSDVAMWEYVIYDEHGTVILDPNGKMIPQPLQAPDTPPG